MTSATPERRKAERYAVDLRVEFRHLGRPDDTYADLTRDISAGGIFVDTTVGLEIGTEVALEITPGNSGTPIQVRAKVVRVEEQQGETGSKATTRTRGMALRFVDPIDTNPDLARLVSLAQQMQLAHGQPSKSAKKR